MKFGFVGAFATMLLGAGWVAAQAPAPTMTGGAAPAAPAAPALAAPALAAPALAATSQPALTAPSQPAPGPAVGTNGSAYLPSNAAAGPGDGYQCWVRGDYLLWRIQNTTAPSLITAAPAGVLTVAPLNTFVPINPGLPAGTGFATLSALTTASTVGASSLDEGEHSGARLTAGFWCDPDQLCGGEVSFFWLDKRAAPFSATTGNTASSFTANTGFTQTTFLVTPGAGGAFTTSVLTTNPLVLTGQTSATVIGGVASQIWGGEANVVSNWLYIGGFRFGALAGFRYLNFTEDLNLTDTITLSNLTANGAPMTVLVAGVPANSLIFASRDSIIAHNNFYGGQIGADMEATCRGFFVAARARIALGVMDQTVNINSQSVFMPPTAVAGLGSMVTFGGAAAGPGGLLSSPLDQGKHSRDRIAWVPEINVKLGYNFTHWLRGYVGYDWLYASNVARPTNQTALATQMTTVQIAGTTNQINVAQPMFRFSDSSIFAQGLTFGLELRY
jgi:hypothetical protein